MKIMPFWMKKSLLASVALFAMLAAQLPGGAHALWCGCEDQLVPIQGEHCGLFDEGISGESRMIPCVKRCHCRSMHDHHHEVVRQSTDMIHPAWGREQLAGAPLMWSLSPTKITWAASVGGILPAASCRFRVFVPLPARIVRSVVFLI